MPSDTQSNINVSHFDKLIARLEEAFHYYQDERDVNFQAYLIPVLKDAKNPESFGPVYERDAEDRWKVRDAVRLKAEEAHNRIKNGRGNIGLIGFKDVYCKNPLKPDYYSFVIFDFDIAKGKGTTVFPKDKLLAWVQSQNVFATRTRSGGYQVIGVNDGRYDNALIYYDGIKAGEIRAWKEYALIAGSYVPVTEEDRAAGNVAPDANGRYEVINDVPVRIIENRDLPDGFEIRADDARVKHALETLKVDISVNPNIKQDWRNDQGESVDDIREDDERLDELLEGPFDEDRSGGDFYVVRKLWENRFAPQQIAEILRYHRFYEKTEREDYVTHTIAKVVGTPQRRTKEEAAREPVEILKNVERYKANEFPPTLPRDKYVVHMRGLPRVGKSRKGLVYITQRGGGTYVAPNHAIIEQQFNTMIKLAPELTSVWLVGKHHACRWTDSEGKKGNCTQCAYRPSSIYQNDDSSRSLTTESYEILAQKALARFKHLKWDLIRENYIEACPYYLLHYAEEFAKVCFTVPQFTVSDENLTRVSPRELMVIDEDTSFNYFEPASVELLEFAVRGVNITTISHVSYILDAFKKLRDEIGSKRPSVSHWWDEVITDMMDRYEMIEEIFTEFNQNPTSPIVAGGPRVTAHQAREALRSRLLALDYNFGLETREEKDVILKKITEYERDLDIVTENGLSELFEPFIFPFENNRFVWVGDILYMVGDKEKIIRMPVQADQYLLIGFTEAELFAQQLLATKRTVRDIREKPGQATIDHDFDRNALQVELTDFPYAQNFHAFKFIGTAVKQKRMLRYVLKWIDQENADSEGTKTPYLVLCSSKKDQQKLWEHMNSGETHMSRKESILRTKMFWRIGIGVLFYQNSTISRGIDVPWFDALFVHSTKFAQPYWKAVCDYGERWVDQSASNMNALKAADFPGVELARTLAAEDHENAKKYLADAKAVERSKLSDETTNACLRLSPIPGVEDNHLKALIIMDKDFDLINLNATKNMNVWEITEGMDLTLLGVEIQKIIKQPNPSALFELDKDIEEFKNSESPKVLYEEKLLKIKMSTGRLLGEKLVELESLISTVPESVDSKYEIEEVCDYILRNIFEPLPDKRRSSDSTIKSAFRMLRKAHVLKAKVRRADIYAAIRHLIDTKRLVIEKDRKDNKQIEYYRLGEVKKKHEQTIKRPLAPTHGQEADW